jgi:2-hydroxychromene-2-carboxylate isomerase
MADLDFFFDFISPYTYLARTQLDGIAARTGARFRMWPMHLLNLMKIVGNTPTTVVCRNKRKYAGQDIGRWCARYQVPVKLNPHLMKGDHSLTLKGALVAQEMNLEDRYNGAMFSAFWTDAVNINDRAELVRHLEAAGLDGSAVLKEGRGNRIRETPGSQHPARCRARCFWFTDLFSSATMFSLGTIGSTSSKID